MITIFKCTSSHTRLNGCSSGDLFILICRHTMLKFISLHMCLSEELCHMENPRDLILCMNVGLTLSSNKDYTSLWYRLCIRSMLKLLIYLIPKIIWIGVFLQIITCKWFIFFICWNFLSERIFMNVLINEGNVAIKIASCKVHTISFQTFFVWTLLLVVHIWNSSSLRSNLLHLQCTCFTVPKTSGRPHGTPLMWVC